MSKAAELTCAEFMRALASAAPTPGGGGAAAFVGALGMALGNMVGSLTLGKEEYANVQSEILALKEQADALQTKLLRLVDLDAEVFDKLAQAYRLPKETAEQKAHKAEVMEASLRDCVAVPLEIMQRIGETIELHEHFAAKGTAVAISDVGCGVVCCKAALQAGSLNVFINTNAMSDRDYAREVNQRAESLLERYCSRADAVYADIVSRFG